MTSNHKIIKKNYFKLQNHFKKPLQHPSLWNPIKKSRKKPLFHPPFKQIAFPNRILGKHTKPRKHRLPHSAFDNCPKESEPGENIYARRSNAAVHTHTHTHAPDTYISRTHTSARLRISIESRSRNSRDKWLTLSALAGNRGALGAARKTGGVFRAPDFEVTTCIITSLTVRPLDIYAGARLDVARVAVHGHLGDRSIKRRAIR